MKDIINYTFAILCNVHLYLVYVIIISFILEKIGNFYLFVNIFLDKKTDFLAEGAADSWFVYYLLFGIIVCSIDLFYFNNGPEGVSKWVLLLLFSICYLPLAFIVYKFIYHFQGRKKLTPFRKKFNKKYRSIKKKLKK